MPGHGQVNSPQLWWLTVGLLDMARADPTAPMLMPDSSIRMPVGQFRFSRLIGTRNSPNSTNKIQRNH
jgi:hypothetical protein